MKGLNKSVITVLFALFSNLAHASDSMDTDKYMLDMSSAGISSRTVVRVKVFPHDRDYKPQGADIVKDRFTISTEGECQLQSADPSKAAPVGQVLKKFNALEFNTSAPGAFFFKCSKPFTLTRAQGFAFTYNGSLYVRNLGAELEAVNLIDLKSYLRGVVPSEVYKDWPLETLKTQAVAARTYAVYHLVYARRFSSERTWDVDDTINFQAYTGISLISDRTDAAIEATEGQILTFRGNVIQAFYHADSGGQTEDALSVWSQAIPFTVSRPEAPEVRVNKNIWEKPFALQHMEKELRDMGHLEGNRTLKSLVVPVAGRSPSGRVKSVVMIDSSGQHKALPLSIFRRVVGQLPSPIFTLDKDPKNAKNLVVRGVGFGHGVGMSQQGAAALAGQKSWDYKQILGYYYVNTTLCSVDGIDNANVPTCKSQRVAQARN